MDDLNEISLDTVVITDQNTQVKEFELETMVGLRNPYSVLNDEGVAVGAALINFRGGIVPRVQVHLYLDPATPERLDLEVNPGSIRVDLSGLVFSEQGHLIGHVVLKRGK